jgi:hypothetical protein
MQTPERHVIGDIVFKSVAAAAKIKPGRHNPCPPEIRITRSSRGRCRTA